MEKNSRPSLEKDVQEMMKHRKRARLIPKTQLEDLPVELIHHIQSFLPVKEAARTCFFSKPWPRAWSTCPNLRFPFLSIPHEKYHSFMSHTLLRYRSNNIPIQSFDLRLTISNHETASLAENWIRHVSNPKTCLRELSLDISVYKGSLTLPLEIFSSENLKSITVKTNLVEYCGLKFFNSVCSNPVMIKCVSLRVLDLELVSITDNILANLLSTCKLLENIRLVWCKDLQTVKVKNLAFLRELIIHSRDPNSILEVTDVPVLRMFHHSPMFTPIRKPMPFQMDSLGSATQLIICNVLMDDGFFDTINSKLPLLESLTIKIDNWAVENWIISSVSLKRLFLLNTWDKSVIFFGSVKEDIKKDILQALPFKVGKLPVKYLGIPLMAKRLGIKECKCLVDKVKSMQAYWAAVVKIPKTIINDIDRVLKKFLWSNFKLSKGRLKVAWKIVCKPKCEGGLRNGRDINTWSDNWCTIGHLSQFITNRMITEARIKDNCVLADMMDNGDWLWPEEWIQQIPMLVNIPVPRLNEYEKDCVKCKSGDGKLMEFNVKNAWWDLRDKMEVVKWWKVVWFPHCYPRNAFILWMEILGKLYTQDRIQKWNNGILLCPLCSKVNDSHDHLFFKCDFSKEIWRVLKIKLNMENVPNEKILLKR
uniref:Uncharacterized protein n=1 Tax=Tanacetum cinerariifolium TaxID=118510 RepID=A0A6L2N0R1_TANCI|nr:hypothetical protein [Tanacetum cinerariifolium]